MIDWRKFRKDVWECWILFTAGLGFVFLWVGLVELLTYWLHG